VTKPLLILPALLALALAVAAPANADAGPLSPAVVEQMALADKLAALGDDRRDPLLLIAAAHLRRQIDDHPIGRPAASVATAAVLARARQHAGARRDLANLADDLAAQRGRAVRVECDDVQRSRCDLNILY